MLSEVKHQVSRSPDSRDGDPFLGQIECERLLAQYMRAGFQGAGGKPVKFDMRFYTGEGPALAGGGPSGCRPPGLRISVATPQAAVAQDTTDSGDAAAAAVDPAGGTAPPPSKRRFKRLPQDDVPDDEMSRMTVESAKKMKRREKAVLTVTGLGR